MAVWVNRLNTSQAHQGAQAHNALCLLKADLKHRVDAGKKLVRQHPDILVRFHVTRAYYESQLRNQERTIEALKKGLEC